MKIKCYCIICNKYIGEYYKGFTRKLCSKECKIKYYSKICKGKKNPNYKHGRNIMNRCKICKKEIWNRSIYCNKCKYKELKPSFLGKKHTKKALKIIGQKSKEKFTEEYNNRIRKLFEEKGLWIPLEHLSAYKRYYRLCEWDKEIRKCNNFFVVRDHKYSRYDGFINDINPLIIKHPVNLKRMARSKNISKGPKSSISLEQLHNKILKYNGKWSKHDKCLVLLQKVVAL